MNKGVHDAQEDFPWLVQDLEWRPTCLYKIVPLQPDLDGYHDTSGYMCGEVSPTWYHRITSEP